MLRRSAAWLPLLLSTALAAGPALAQAGPLRTHPAPATAPGVAPTPAPGPSSDPSPDARPGPSLGLPAASPDPSEPPAQVVEDAGTQVRFRLPAGWNLARKDGEMSTFHLDARTAPRTAQLRAVADLAFNPYPLSTFSGALFYLSVTPHSTAGACAAQATARPAHAAGSVPVGDTRFLRGHDEHGQICTEARDDVYTALRGGACVRFDLAMNSFCGGEVSGAQDLTEAQIANIEGRLRGVLDSVEFMGAPSGRR